MFSQTVEYALRAVVYLAEQVDARTTQQIAVVTKVPAAYLAKVLQNLSRFEVVRSQRGLHGGFSLGKSATELTIWEVVQAVEPIRRIRECPLELESHRTKLCALHRKLDDALAEIERTFRDCTIADILAVPFSDTPDCSFPFVEEPAREGRISLK
ncbi:MAG: Rrf2 family transcriptional regulator [Planctomycetes bacterium]|nr:Rrf2 family transcriptional regulator [Planctomycetota bacterium]